MNNNLAVSEMMSASDRINSFAFNNSQPLKPSFSGLIHDELAIKANETKVSVTKNIIEAMNKKLAQDIKRSTPNFAGLDYKA